MKQKTRWKDSENLKRKSETELCNDLLIHKIQQTKLKRPPPHDLV